MDDAFDTYIYITSTANHILKISQDVSIADF